MALPQLWHIWNTQQWPASIHDEQQFVTALKKRTRSRRQPTLKNTPRASITALVTTLRHGGTLQQLTQLLPGERPADLLSAYNLLTTYRQTATEAWHELCTTPTAWTNPYIVLQAAALLPTPTRQALLTYTTVGPKRAQDEITHYQSRIQQTQILAHQIEEKLSTPNRSYARRIELGLRLHHLTQPSLWSDDFYLPRRITDLSPTRVADLLGERTSNHHDV